jgi:hypothetical protein
MAESNEPDANPTETGHVGYMRINGTHPSAHKYTLNHARTRGWSSSLGGGGQKRCKAEKIRRLAARRLPKRIYQVVERYACNCVTWPRWHCNALLRGKNPTRITFCFVSLCSPSPGCKVRSLSLRRNSTVSQLCTVTFALG